ncbi:hypothetical protein EW146_g10059 [Bondarzewia mesenterica]|uniref:Uncharacterized protein n=1 Tax=Bondarzewia mesenterica TaxID=1095465 RepID=A0A4V3XC81_9AGAM|nr:hypothetical protein EW146_g10059 [Bondarzewia mesenterica]
MQISSAYEKPRSETEAEPRMLGRVVTFTSDTITLNNDSDDDGHKPEAAEEEFTIGEEDVLRNAIAIRSAALCLSMSDGKLPISDGSTVAAPNCTRDCHPPASDPSARAPHQLNAPDNNNSWALGVHIILFYSVTSISERVESYLRLTRSP